MSELTSPLRPLRTSHGATEQQTILRPVSRISFTLTDKNAFEKAVEFSVKWLGRKTRGCLPTEALEFKSFDTRGLEGHAPCHAIRLDDQQGSIWASRIDDPGSRPRVGEVWSTELFVERRANSVVRFGAQLMSRRPLNSASPHSTRPKLVYDLLRTLSAEADGESISESVTHITSRDTSRLLDLIYRPNRRLPIIAVSNNSQNGTQLDTGKLALRLSGAAHLVALDLEASWELTRLLGKRMSTFNGAVRIYMPGVVEEEEDPYQHPLWLAQSSGQSTRLINTIAEQVFPLGFRDSDGETRFWHLAQLRQAVSATEARRKIGSETDQLKSQIAALGHRVDELEETLETAEALEKIASENEKIARHEVAQLKKEINDLRKALYRYQHENTEQNNSQPIEKNRPLKDYDDLEDWADEILGPNILLHSKALKDCKQNGHMDMLKRIESTLLAIRDHWIPYKIKGGLELRDAAIKALATLGVEDDCCFARREKAKEKPEYSVRDGNITRVLYDHFKYGTSRSNAEQFRIYYSWDGENQKLIIGKMPSHLPNDAS